MNAPGQPAHGDTADPQAAPFSPPEMPVPPMAGGGVADDPRDTDDDEFEPL